MFRSACRLKAPRGEVSLELVRVDLVLRTSQGLQEIPTHDFAPHSSHQPHRRGGVRPARRSGPSRPVRRAPWRKTWRSTSRAEREGFEPSDPVTQVNSLAVSPIRPLSHLSLPLWPIFGLYSSTVGGVHRPGHRDDPRVQGRSSSEARGTWRLRVFVGTDPVTGNPRQRTKTVEAKNQTEARAALRAWQKELDDNRVATDSSATVRSLVEEWLRHSEARGRAPRTLHDARRSAETSIFPEFGDVPIAELTPRHLDEWYRKLATGEGRDRPLKPTSIRRHHAVLSAALSQAVRWGWLDRNPAERAEPPPLGRTELRVPTPDEVRALLARGAERNERWGMLLSLAVLTGARRGELCAMRWTDVEGDTDPDPPIPLPGGDRPWGEEAPRAAVSAGSSWPRRANAPRGVARPLQRGRCRGRRASGSGRLRRLTRFPTAAGR